MLSGSKFKTTAVSGGGAVLPCDTTPPNTFRFIFVNLFLKSTNGENLDSVIL